MQRVKEVSDLDNIDGRLAYAAAWIKDNDAAISVLKQRRPEVRSAWLDEFIRSTLISFIEYDSNEFDNHIQALFVLIRELQLVLKIRNEMKSDNSDFHLNAFTPLVRSMKDKSSEVLPGSYSGTRQHLEFKLGVFKEIERKHPVITDDRGFAIDTGYGHDVSRLLSLTGYVPKQVGVRPISNLHQRVEHGLTNQIDPFMLSMVDDFLLLLYGCCESKSIRLESKSQSGLPLRLFGRGYKTLSFINAVCNLDDILEHSTNPRYLLDHYDSLYAFLQGNRQSPDAGGKKRYITSEADNAVGLAGNTLQDNHPDLPNIPSALRKHFATMRYRFVWGGNIVSNSIVNAIGTSCRHTYGLTYDFTFKHKGREDLLSKIKRFYGKNETSDLHRSECDMVVIDVTSFDLDYPRDVLKKYIDFFSNTPIYDFFFRTAFAPSVQGTLDKDNDSKDPIINGDLFNFDPNDYLDSGLPSGWSWVSDAGKIMALNIYYCLVKSHLLDEHTIEQLHSFLQGELEYGCLNLGDDNVILCPNGQFDNVLKSLNDHSVWLVDLEPGARFIGFPLFFDSFGNFRITHDPASYVTNWLTPEREIGGKFSKYWAYGLEQRERVYSDAPIVHDFRKIIMRKWKEVYGTNLDSIIKEHALKQKEELDKASKNDDIINVLYQRLENAPNISLAITILHDLMRDSSVLQWKWEGDDLYEAFGIRIEDLENRPHVRYTEAVLERSGYIRMFQRKVESDYYGDLFVHDKVLKSVNKDFILNRLYSENHICDSFNLSNSPS